jgi:hypothetical protein
MKSSASRASADGAVAPVIVFTGGSSAKPAHWTLDDDVVVALERLRRAGDASLKDIVNDALRPLIALAA